MKDREILERGAHDVVTFNDNLIRIISYMDLQLRETKREMNNMHDRIRELELITSLMDLERKQ
jgi:hypothetical protein